MPPRRSVVKQILYLSSAPVLLGREDLMQILHVSRVNNAASGVTGALLYADGTFLQVLEGETGAVDATLDRIHRDSRHRSLLVMLDSTVSERSFPDWAMELLDVKGLTDQDLADIRSFDDLDKQAPTRARRLLRSLRSRLVSA